MRITKTDDRLLEILSIKNLNSIQYKDLFIANPNKKEVLAPGFLITYGPNNSIMFLTTLDPFFDEFVRRIREVYLEEKDHVIREGIRGKEYIDIDPFTKEMLLHGGLEETSSLYQQYATASSYNESLLMEEDVLKALFPIIDYHLKETMMQLQKVLTNTKLSGGINGNYYITGMMDNMPVLLPIYYEGKDNEWKVTVGNILENAIPIEMEGSISSKGIRVLCSIPEYQYIDYTTYTIENNKPIKERRVEHKEKILRKEQVSLPEADAKEPSIIYALDYSPENIHWYYLPWHGCLGLYEDKWYMTEEGEKTEEEQRDRMVHNRIIYLSVTKDNFFLKEIASKRYHKKKDDRTLGGNIRLDDMEKRKIGFITKDGILVETHFSNRGVTGKYQEALSGKYFYQVFTELDKEKGHFIDQRDGLEEKSDLFDIKKYYKKEEC